jgi:hypothetical protein
MDGPADSVAGEIENVLPAALIHIQKDNRLRWRDRGVRSGMHTRSKQKYEETKQCYVSYPPCIGSDHHRLFTKQYWVNGEKNVAMPAGPAKEHSPAPSTARFFNRKVHPV